ncbi:Hypothetical protein CINCED_3A001250 [Cinara cedri]|uniref:Uncharacterized protein n=1 Tax=Cinara cedri TaxID=506608 RepID=A0A5E4M7I0_9HEMI|nr:Hypothetical protein CINCED_3A001250 [Cinara cedri]
MFTITIPCSALFAFCCLVPAFLSNTVYAVPLDPVSVKEGVFTYPSRGNNKPLHIYDAPASLKKLQPHIDSSAPLIRCYCNLPVCLTATGGMPVCHTRQGCYSRIQMSVSELTGPSQVADPTTPTTTTTIQSIPDEFDERLIMSNMDHVINGAYGCLDLLPTNQTCNDMLKVSEDSEFPALPSVNSSETLHAYRCCQNDMCNKRTNPTTTAIREAREALRKTFQSSFQQRKPSVSETKTVVLAAALAYNAKTNKEPIRGSPIEIAPEIFPEINAENKATTNNQRTIGAVDNLKVMKWLEFADSGDSKKTTPAGIARNTMQFPSTTLKGESSQRVKPIFVAPEEFPTNSVYPPIYYRKPNFPVADFIKIINIVKPLKLEESEFPANNIISRRLNQERKVHAENNANVERDTAAF